MSEEQKAVEMNPVVDTKPNEVPVVPDDWAALGAEAGYNPKAAEALRLFIVGPSGEGKTTFAASIPDNLILDFENRADAITGAKSVRIKIKDYAHADAIVEKLKADAKKGNKRFKRVTIDTVDEFIAMIKHQIEEEKNVEDVTDYRSEGYGYNVILQRFWSKMQDLEQAGYSWAVVGHLKTKRETNPATGKSETKLRDAIYPSISQKVLNLCDFKMTIYCLAQVIEKKKAQKLPDGRVVEVPAGTETKQTYYADTLTTAQRSNKASGVPTMERKFELPLIGGWDVFKQKYEAAVAVERAKYEQK